MKDDTWPIVRVRTFLLDDPGGPAVRVLPAPPPRILEEPPRPLVSRQVEKTLAVLEAEVDYLREHNRLYRLDEADTARAAGTPLPSRHCVRDIVRKAAVMLRHCPPALPAGGGR